MRKPVTAYAGIAAMSLAVGLVLAAVVLAILPAAEHLSLNRFQQFSPGSRAIVHSQPLVFSGLPVMARLVPRPPTAAFLVIHKGHHGGKPKHSAPYPVKLSASVGFEDTFRQLSVVPVRITAYNKTSSTISGTLNTPDESNSSNSNNSGYYGGGSFSGNAAYQVPLTLPPGARKTVTMYLPASAINGEVAIRMRTLSGNVIGYTYNDPSQFAATTIVVGSVTQNPLSTAWLTRFAPGGGEYARTIDLTPATFDPLPGVLQNFSDIVLNDSAASQLSTAQIAALQQYVQDGGGLVLVGGPGWQQDLKPLHSLVPGVVTGSATLSNLDSLTSVQPLSPNPAGGAAIVSVLRQPQGEVLASEHGIPLVVDKNDGLGHIMYLAFDPNLNPVADWHGAGSLISRLMLRANPVSAALGPNWSQTGQSPSPFFNYPGGAASDLGNELKNIPSAALATVILFIGLAAFFILILGPISFVALFKARRLEWLWGVLPVGALLCTAATFGVGSVTQAHTVTVNTIGMITLDGPASAQPAELYMGVFSPLAGDYQLTYAGNATPIAVPDPSVQYAPEKQFLYQEGTDTKVMLPKMGLWSLRSAGFLTTLSVHGNVTYKLHVAPNGDLLGWVHNGTSLRLIHPAIIAGRSYQLLSDLPAGATEDVHVAPFTNVHSNQYGPILDGMYGSYPAYGGCCYSLTLNSTVVSPPSYGMIPPASTSFGHQPQTIQLGGGLGAGCCYGSGPAPERNFRERMRNAATQLPDVQTLDRLSEVMFIAWNEQSLGPITVNGSAPDRRNLNLIVKPMSVSFQRGPFKLRSGTIGATLVDIKPAYADSNNCCTPPVPGAIELGAGGSATFEFYLGSRNVHFRHLSIYANQGGANGRNQGRLWDWSARQWVTLNLASGSARVKAPARFVSPIGVIRLRLYTWDQRHDMYIENAKRFIQITGDGWVS